MGESIRGEEMPGRRRSALLAGVVAAAITAALIADPAIADTIPDPAPSPIDVTELPALPSSPVADTPPPLPEGTTLPPPEYSPSQPGPLVPPPVSFPDDLVNWTRPAEVDAARAARVASSFPGSSAASGPAADVTGGAVGLEPDAATLARQAVAVRIEAFLDVVRTALSRMSAKRPASVSAHLRHGPRAV